MSTTPPGDPFGLLRQWVGQWEQLVNQHGTEMLARPEVAQAVQGATAAGLQAQSAVHEMVGRALTAANLPSKSDIEALGERLAAIEAALRRIEGREAPVPPRPAPKRTRKPA